MKQRPQNDRSRRLSPEQRLRLSALRVFCDPLAEECWTLCSLPPTEWKQLLRWLDTSGLALYFLERLQELNLTGWLPVEVHARLLRSLSENTARTDALVAETRAILETLHTSGALCAVLKGFSLCPESVPRPELRSQLDLDFLIEESSAPTARRLLEARGYRLHAISGTTWEFKINYASHSSLADLYKPGHGGSVELHLAPSSASCRSLLPRTEQRDFRGFTLPVLPPAELLVVQALHLAKHLCSEFARTAHLLEFRRHVLNRRHDLAFWRAVQEIAEQRTGASFHIGLATSLVAELMGGFAPPELTAWTVDRLPSEAKLWVRIYGARSVLSSFPGSKLYLLLHNQRQLTGASGRSVRAALLPSRLPAPIAPAPTREGISHRLHRHRVQCAFVLFRLRFHVVEDLRYLGESLRWGRALKALTP